MLASPKLVNVSEELHLLETPKSEFTSVGVGKEILTVGTEVNEFDALSDGELSQILEIDRPHVVIGARVFLCVGQVDGGLCLPNQRQVAEWTYIATRNHLLNSFIEHLLNTRSTLKIQSSELFEQLTIILMPMVSGSDSSASDASE